MGKISTFFHLKFMNMSGQNDHMNLSNIIKSSYLQGDRWLFWFCLYMIVLQCFQNIIFNGSMLLLIHKSIASIVYKTIPLLLFPNLIHFGPILMKA